MFNTVTWSTRLQHKKAVLSRGRLHYAPYIWGALKIFEIASLHQRLLFAFLGHPERPFRTGLCFTRDVFFFSPRFLRDPSTETPETLPHDRNLVECYKLTSGDAPSKNYGPKTCKISVNYGPLQILIWNISGMRQHMKNRKDVRIREIHTAFEDKSPVKFGLLTAFYNVSSDPLKMHCLGDYISAHRGCCALKFFHELEIDQALLAHTEFGMGSGPPPPKKN